MNNPQDGGHRSLAAQAKVKCFGSKAALCAEATVAVKQDMSGVPTVNLEIAPRLAESVDWQRKIVIQLSDSELPLLCALVMGYIPALHLKRPEKGIEIERQDNKLFVKASSGTGNLFVMPVTIGDTFRLATLLLSQLKQQAGFADETLMLAALRGSASLYRAN